jgi:tetratricopeptide (TPR) repeat protein
MESNRQLDIARPSAVLFLISVLSCALAVAAAAQSRPDQLEIRIRALFAQQRWQEIVDLRPPLGVSPNIDFDYGIAAARLQHWGDARSAFRSGLRLSPRDSRFMVELAGVSFKQGNYAEAERWLRHALRLSPADTYSLDFLATTFFLDGNLDAALKYWNKVAKPHIVSIRTDPRPRINPVLLDRAFAVAPASELDRWNLLTTQARLENLSVFSSFRFDLQARDGGDFDLVFRNSQRHGCGVNTWACLLSSFGELPAQTVHFNYFDLGQRALNFYSLLRWDGEKRRAVAEVELPVAGTPKWRLRFGADLRDENWAVRTSFSGTAPLLSAFNLKRETVRGEFTDVVSGRWQWSTATEISNRDYGAVFPGILNFTVLTPGRELKQSFAVRSTLVRWPERRLTLDSLATFAAARFWSGDSRDFSQLQGSLRVNWLPQHSGTRYEVEHHLRAGKTFGNPPFDELFMLGVLGDNDLLMKAHIATRDGKKGSAPLGRNYFLSTFEATRDVSPVSILHIRVGPFVDTGKITDPFASLGSRKWLWDLGVEAKLQAFGFRVVISYGRDLRSGRSAILAFPQ